MKPSPSIPLPRLDVAKKRALRLLLGEHVESGLSVTVSAMRKLGAKVAGKPFTQELAQGALSDLGYVVGPDLMATAGTKGQLKTECIWIPAPLDRPLSKAERAKLLSNRLAVLSEAFVADLLEDPQLAYAELNERAIEASRFRGCSRRSLARQSAHERDSVSRRSWGAARTRRHSHFGLRSRRSRKRPNVPKVARARFSLG